MPADTAELATAAGSEAGTVLVVEDEVLVRLLVAEHLRDCGYRVIEATAAAEAVAVLQAGVPVDILFSDVQMPGAVDGFALARWVRQHHPRVRVILTSGHEAVAAKCNDLCVAGGFLPKPYDPARLVAQIRRLLAGH